MNFQYDPISIPLKVLIVNPLHPSSQLLIMKIMSGKIFGPQQYIDLILLVYSNEVPTAEALKSEIERCAFVAYNSIIVSSDLPSISDADVFVFLTHFPNPNIVDTAQYELDEQFDSLYLLLKIAHNFATRPSVAKKNSEEKVLNLKRKRKEKVVPRKPIFIADGLVTLEIIWTFSKHVMPCDTLFCPTALESIAKSVLGDFLKAESEKINDVLVWAASDESFHCEVEKPILREDKVNLQGVRCVWDMVSKDVLESLNLDHLQFNASWLKKEFIEKISTIALSNPHGYIYLASEIAKIMKKIWSARCNPSDTKIYSNMGVVSDGSLGFTKGRAFVLPIVLNGGDTWEVDTRYSDTTYLLYEINRMNKITATRNQKLTAYCTQFLEENVIKQAFIPIESFSTWYGEGSEVTSNEGLTRSHNKSSSSS